MMKFNAPRIPLEQLEKLKRDRLNQKAAVNEMTSGSLSGINKNIAQGNSLFDNSLGADKLRQLAAERSPETASLIRNAMEQSQGLSAGEGAALLNSANANVQSSQAAALRSLRGAQAGSGVRGGLAVAQQMNVRGQGAQQMADFNAQMVQQNFLAKQQGLATAANIVSNQENVEKDLASDRLSTILQLRGQDMTLLGAKEQARGAAKACFTPDTLIELEDGSFVSAQNVALGEVLKGGGEVLSIIKSVRQEGELVFNYEGVLVTAGHSVKEDGVWKRVYQSPKAIPVESDCKFVYNFITSNHRIFITDVEFGDHEEMDFGMNMEVVYDAIKNGTV